MVCTNSIAGILDRQRALLRLLALCNSVIILHSPLRRQRMPIQIQRDILVLGQVEEGGEEFAFGGVVEVGCVLVCARPRRSLREIKVLVEGDGERFFAEFSILVLVSVKLRQVAVIIIIGAICYGHGDVGEFLGCSAKVENRIIRLDFNILS